MWKCYGPESLRALFACMLLALGTVSGKMSYGQCGVSSSDQYQWMERYQRNQRQAAVPGSARSMTAIPVAYHLVGRSNGEGMPPAWQAWESVCVVNETFAGTGLFFYVSHISTTASNGIFNDHTLQINQLAMRGLKRPDALNVFVVNNAAALGSGNVTGYFDETDDWVVVARSTLRPGNHTVAHEIGHFFSLFHPHLGWDGQAWSAALHGNPAPATAPDGTTPTELQNGSNCATAADRLCDTPPDYNFGLAWQQSCTYSGPALDPAGMAVNPDETLVMSYFNDSCRAVFSPQQTALMLADVQQPERAYLQTGFVPQQQGGASPVSLAGPLGLTPHVGGSLTFAWQRHPLAATYYLEVDRSPSFALEPKGILTSDTSVSFSYPFVTGGTYHWRVFAYSPNEVCLPVSAPATFTADAPDGILPAHLTSLSVRREGQEAIITLDRPAAATYRARVISPAGQVVRRLEGHFLPGENEIRLNLSGLPAGMWYVDFEDHSGVGKLLIGP